VARPFPNLSPAGSRARPKTPKGLTSLRDPSASRWSQGDRTADKIQYLAEPEIARDGAALRCYLDLGAAGADAVVAAINALGATPAARAIARCSVGRRP